jgi:putative ABC transport system permease protein
VVGVVPPAPEILSQGDIWTPLVIDPSKERRLNHLIVVVGRLKRGMSLSLAQAQMNIVARRVGEQYPEVRDWGIHLQTIYDYVVAKELRTALLVILGAVILVLTAAAANVANLLLSRAVARQKEVAVRIAIGASRTNLLSQLLTESTVLAFAGGVAGFVMGVFAVRLLNASLPPNLLPVRVTVDGAVLLFALAMTFSCAIFFGMAPAWQTWRADLHSLLKEGGQSGAGVPRSLLRQALIGGELALATLLLIAAGLLLQTFERLGNARLGFRAERLLTFEITPSPSRYQTVAKRTALYRGLVERLESLPGVSGAAVTTCVPFGNGLQSRTPAAPVGRSLLEAGQ